MGAFLAAIAGAVVSGAIWQIAQGDTLGETGVLTFLAAVPGCLIALAILYTVGSRDPRHNAGHYGDA